MGLFMASSIKAKANRPGVRVFVSVPCVSGLPVPVNTPAQLYYFDDHIEIDAGGVEYDLALDNVQGIAVQQNVEQQTQFVSSAGGAILGAAVAGPIGAAIGGRAKKKTTKQTNWYLVIHYIGKNGDPACVTFLATYALKSWDMVKLFRKRPHQQAKIEL